MSGKAFNYAVEISYPEQTKRGKTRKYPVIRLLKPDPITGRAEYVHKSFVAGQIGCSMNALLYTLKRYERKQGAGVWVGDINRTFERMQARSLSRCTTHPVTKAKLRRPLSQFDQLWALAQAALASYTRHRDGCPWIHQTAPCSCGLADLQAQLNALHANKERDREPQGSEQHGETA